MNSNANPEDTVLGKRRSSTNDFILHFKRSCLEVDPEETESDEETVSDVDSEETESDVDHVETKSVVMAEPEVVVKIEPEDVVKAEPDVVKAEPDDVVMAEPDDVKAEPDDVKAEPDDVKAEPDDVVMEKAPKRGPKCEYLDCHKVPGYGFLSDRKRRYCGEHSKFQEKTHKDGKKEKAVCLNYATCTFYKCYEMAKYNYFGSEKPLWCRKHISVRNVCHGENFDHFGFGDKQGQVMIDMTLSMYKCHYRKCSRVGTKKGPYVERLRRFSCFCNKHPK
jgi:hypothetical protein